jgi:FtsP/CotA-like multicopper oxidase with cupredoxin domain
MATLALHALAAAFVLFADPVPSDTAPAPRAAPNDAAIVANDNRRAAGRLEGGVLTLHLEIRAGTLHPEEDGGPGVPALAFGEEGGPLQAPGPMLRVARGTEIHMRVRNASDSALFVHGLGSRASARDTALCIPAGEAREVHFAADRIGTYYYWASLKPELESREWYDSQLSGAFIVDPVGARTDDRVFVIGLWQRLTDPSSPDQDALEEHIVINGKAWPHTERLAYTQGDSVRWRWINPTVSAHPMHLHGFYFNVESKGDAQREHAYTVAERPLVVTQLMQPGETMRVSWLPERPGNWIFHCHFAFHVSHHLAVRRDSAHEAAHMDGSHGSPAATYAAGAQPSSEPTMHDMSGMVMGISIAPRAGAHPVTLASSTVRDVRLVAQSRPKHYGRLAAMGYVVQEGAREPAVDSVVVPGPTLVLQRGQPVRVRVVNHLTHPTAVHWHGIELESFPDGVPGWSGMPGRIMPPIAPGDSFVAEFVPPRAGTFIYHTHTNEQLQLGSGLYGALIVVPPDAPYDTATNRLVVVGGAGPADSIPAFEFQSPGYVNGSAAPPPMDLVVGRTYRFRLININPDWRVIFSIASDTALARWRPVAKDGADLPPAQRRLQPSHLITGTGETADFEFTPTAPGNLRLEIKTQLPGWIIPIELRAR